MANQAQKSRGQMDRSRTKKSKFKGKRNSRNGEDKQLESREERVESPTNDPTWYAQTPELLQLAANIPFSQATGTKFNLNFYNDETGNKQIFSEDWTIPGIMTLSLIPVPSSATSANSPLNIAATSIYSFVRHANSGTPQYDAPDLMIYNISMAQVYCYINFLQRIYGCMNVYANMNRYLPRALVEAQGVDYDSILQNLPNFKFGIDSLIHKASSLACPASMTYFQRVAFLFSGIYAEGESIKDQLYMYIPQGFMQYSATAVETGGSLTYVPFRTSSSVRYTYSQLIDFGNDLLDPIISSQDMNIMSGDVLKAYGSDGVLKLALVPDNYSIVPTTDLAVLEQFQNAGFTQAIPNKVSITQSQTGRAGYLISTVQTSYDAYRAGLVNANKVLTTILTNPGPADVIERTRLMVSGFATPGTGGSITLEMATEVPVVLSVVRLNSQTMATVIKDLPNNFSVSASPTQADVQEALDVHCQLENFKFHPAIYYLVLEADGATVFNMALDFDNYAIVNIVDLNRMNEAALLSMFNVNSVAKAY